MQKKEIPTQWTTSHISLLFKKGDSKDISNSRPISLMSCIYKTFATTILRRITRTVDVNQSIEQAGYMKNFSTVDHIHSLKMIIEKYKEYEQPLYLCFIDFCKAFDSISHDYIWKALTAQGIDSEYIEILKVIYKNSVAKVMLEKPGPSFQIQRGVKQGDPLSPKLFLVVLEQIFRELDWTEKGLKIDGSYLSHLRFADDIVLLSEDPAELQYMLETLCEKSKNVGLNINVHKTKILTNREKIPISTATGQIEYNDDYIYLGHLISFKSCNEKEISRRIKSTWTKYWQMKEIFKSSLPTNLKTKVMETCLIPCLTYACQTWTLTEETLRKIQVCQRGMERSYTGFRLKDKTRHSVIRDKTKATDVKHKILRLKWKWTGHLQRVPDDRWTKITTNWYPINKKRKKGRPYMRWQDDIVKVAGKIWSREARDRTTWNGMEEAFTA